jgi:hypothetical protein
MIVPYFNDGLHFGSVLWLVTLIFFILGKHILHYRRTAQNLLICGNSSTVESEFILLPLSLFAPNTVFTISSWQRLSHSHSAGQTENFTPRAVHTIAAPLLFVYLSGRALNTPHPRQIKWQSGAFTLWYFNCLILQAPITVAARSKE